MRTKTLILTAALGVAGAASAMAQVYSVNAVGYINLTAAPGFIMMANQLDNGSGNLVKDLMPAPAEGTTLYKFMSDSGAYDINSFEFGEWSKPDMVLGLGEGAFLRNPTSASFTITLVGEVPQGTLTTEVPAGFAIVSSQVPQAGQIDTVLGYPAVEGDTVYLWASVAQTYIIATYEFGEWSVPPVVGVGDSFFSSKGAPATWTREFSVND
jgi:hypothetical protein